MADLKLETCPASCGIPPKAGKPETLLISVQDQAGSLERRNGDSEQHESDARASQLAGGTAASEDFAPGTWNSSVATRIRRRGEGRIEETPFAHFEYERETS